jgi:CTP:molybdopterin cytidylyltransferase MocA
MLFALIPAAGKSRRMGRPKLTLPFGTRTVLEHVVAAVRTAGADPVLVVVSPDDTGLAEVARAAAAHVLRLPLETPDMRATVEHGLDWCERHYQPGPDDCWLLLPADHPTLHPDVIRPLVLAAANDRSHDVFVPSFEGRRGHPALLRWSLTPALRALPAGRGLNALFHEQPHLIAELPTDCADVIRDMDTPEDYEALRQRLEGNRS